MGTHELVRHAISRDLVEALEILLEGARKGHITGIAFAAVLHRRQYFTNVAGSCERNLTHARGMLATLSDELGDMLAGRDPGETR
jgi:hypothetical protein